MEKGSALFYDVIPASPNNPGCRYDWYKGYNGPICPYGNGALMNNGADPVWKVRALMGPDWTNS